MSKKYENIKHDAARAVAELAEGYLGYDAEKQKPSWLKPEKEFAKEAFETAAKANGLELSHDDAEKVEAAFIDVTEGYFNAVGRVGVETMSKHKDLQSYSAAVNLSKSRKVSASVTRDHDVRIPGRDGKEATVEVRHGYLAAKTDISVGVRLGNARYALKDLAEHEKIGSRTEPLSKE